MSRAQIYSAIARAIVKQPTRPWTGETFYDQHLVRRPPESWAYAGKRWDPNPYWLRSAKKLAFSAVRTASVEQLRELGLFILDSTERDGRGKSQFYARIEDNYLDLNATPTLDHVRLENYGHRAVRRETSHERYGAHFGLVLYNDNLSVNATHLPLPEELTPDQNGKIRQPYRPRRKITIRSRIAMNPKAYDLAFLKYYDLSGKLSCWINEDSAFADAVAAGPVPESATISMYWTPYVHRSRGSQAPAASANGSGAGGSSARSTGLTSAGNGFMQVNPGASGGRVDAGGWHVPHAWPSGMPRL